MEYIKQLLKDAAARNPELKGELQELWELAHEEAEEVGVNAAADMVVQAIKEMGGK